ncbi:Uma2 family endonuclease [Cyanobacterium sp. Dongsha4]|uniref:Uma2 family endonuclease n=1 Tax=Cyanobacterium sp. DS4 TaxID=2878255 RepID=UPI002E8187BC|nr:Uma2 family endonuclease [Cyanobacterium sp. Dongsha4]WVL01038.1 Uma2 family endonuclease [Cyanobacterium sp. Dongsha4]
MVYLSTPLELELQLTDEQFFELCHKHKDLRFERNAQGDLIIMSPTGGLTGNRNADLIYQLIAWNRQKKLGKVFDSSTGFKLPNGSNRSPDASFITSKKWNNLTLEQQEKFLSLAPDFAIELKSPSDKLTNIQEKMQEYIDNGVKLGWLINPEKKEVEIYRQGQKKEVLNNPKILLGEDVLPDFVLDLTEIF